MTNNINIDENNQKEKEKLFWLRLLLDVSQDHWGRTEWMVAKLCFQMFPSFSKDLPSKYKSLFV